MLDQCTRSAPNPSMCRKMVHLQVPTPVQAKNTTSVGFANKTIKKMSKSIHMRFYWLKDRKDKGNFTIYWIPGKNNLADYHSKNHPPYHHTVMLPTILYSPHYVNFLTKFLMQGCINPPKITCPIRASMHTHTLLVVSVTPVP